MGHTYEFTLDRAQKKRGAQDHINGTWPWPKKRSVQWDADIAGLDTQNETLPRPKPPGA